MEKFNKKIKFFRKKLFLRNLFEKSQKSKDFSQILFKN